MAEGGKGSRSGSDSDSLSRTETNVTVSVNKEHGSDVELLLKIRGLKPKGGFRMFLSKFSKHDDPSYLCANAEFTKWVLTDTSLTMTVRVQTEKRRKKNAHGKHTAEATAAAASSPSDDLHVETFDYKIRRFPSDILSESAKLEILQPSGRAYSFIVLTMRKADNGTSWRSFQAEHGTIDASSI